MANDALYGTDVRCLDDVDDPEVLVSGDLNMAYALARRWLHDPEEFEEIGETVPYDCIDVRGWFGQRLNLSDRSTLDNIQTQHQQVLLGDPRVETVTVTASYSQGLLTLSAKGQGAAGPFSLVMSASAVTATILRGG